MVWEENTDDEREREWDESDNHNGEGKVISLKIFKIFEKTRFFEFLNFLRKFEKIKTTKDIVQNSANFFLLDFVLT